MLIRRTALNRADAVGGAGAGASVIIFDCNGVLVDSEQIAAAVAAEEFTRVGIPMTAELVMPLFLRAPAGRHVRDRRGGDRAQAAARISPPRVAAATLERFRAELRAMPHVAHALTWLRGPKCVASSSPTRPHPDQPARPPGLTRFFEPHLFSASDVPNGKPAPDLFLHAAARMGVAPADCIVVEDSPAGVTAATAAGMTRDRLRRRQPCGAPSSASS